MHPQSTLYVVVAANSSCPRTHPPCDCLSSPIVVRSPFCFCQLLAANMELIEAAQFDTILNLYVQAESDQKSEISSLIRKCKKLGQAMKTGFPILQPLPAYYRELVPPRKMCDQLVNSYLQTFEHVYRVVHVPSFQEDYLRYWNNPGSASTAFVVRLLLIAAIGSCFHTGSSNPPSLHPPSSQWIHVAQSWLNNPFEKSRLNLGGIQIHCLLLLARQVNAVGGDLVWVSSGSLLRTAMHMGLHRDPCRLSSMSFYQSELRRRLWATVMEIVLQSSMDSGGSPLIACKDFDTEPPSNYDDSQLSPGIQMAPVPKPSDTFTQTSVQIALMKSLPIRLEIAALINDFRIDLSYDTILRLGADLTAICRSNQLLFQSFRKEKSQLTAFHAKMLGLLTHRFLLSLHHPFAIKAKTDPTYYFSRKVCREYSLSLLSSSSPSLETRLTDEYTRLRIVGGGLFRDVPVHAAMITSQELVSQLQEDSSSFISTSDALSRRELHKAIEDYVELTLSRIKAGEVNVKGYVFASCVLAQINAIQTGTSIEQSVLQASAKSLEVCSQLLKSRVEESASAEPNIEGLIDGSHSFEDEGQLEDLEWDNLLSPRQAFRLPTGVVRSDPDQRWMAQMRNGTIHDSIPDLPFPSYSALTDDVWRT